MSFIDEQLPGQEATRALIVEDILHWRAGLLTKLETAAEHRPLALPVDLESLADQVFTTLEDGFILARAMDEPLKLRDQLRQLRWYFTLLLLPS